MNDFHYCKVEHFRDSYAIMVSRKATKVQPIGNKNYIAEITEWRCPVCDAEEIIQEYSEESYPVDG